jgi:hypothetical protein
VLQRRPDGSPSVSALEAIQPVEHSGTPHVRRDGQARPADFIANGTEPVFPKRHSGTVLTSSNSERSARDAGTLRSDRVVIDAILADLEAVDPDRVPEFIEVVRQSAGSENFDQILRIWQTTVGYQARSSTRRPTTPPTGRLNSDYGVDRSGSEARRSDGPLRPSTSPDRADSAVQRAGHRQEESGPLLIPQAIGPAGSSIGNCQTPGTTRITYRAPVESGPGTPSRIGSKDLGSDSVPDTANTRAQLRRLAAGIEQQDAQSSDEQWKLQVQSRLLYLLAGDAQRAVKPLVGMPPNVRDYWRNQLWAVARALEAGDDPAKAGEMLALLNDAALALRQQVGLTVSVPVFCREVTNFGNYREFESYDFAAGTKVVVYWEVRNFASVEQQDGFRTRLAASFEILDHAGKSVHRSEHPFPDDVCRQRRHDYFNAVLFQLPKDLRPGRHVLKVTVRDVTADRIAEKQREFIVK